MPRTPLQILLLGLVLLVTVPPLARLCRGRSPSRFAQGNLPAWERKAPRPARPRVALRNVPLPPGAVQWQDTARSKILRAADENALLAGLEASSARTTAQAGDAGAWLERACALGLADRGLAAKQSRVALRLMNAQGRDGFLAAGPAARRWSASQIAAYSRNLRGLLAFYALTRRPAAIYAALQAGDLVVSTPLLPPTPARPAPGIRRGSVAAPSEKHPLAPVNVSPLVLPMARLSLLSGDARYRRWALEAAHRGQCDGGGWCALYLATGQRAQLRRAQEAWKHDAALRRADPDCAAALLALTGAPGYAAGLGAAPWPCPLAPGSLAYGQTPRGLAVNRWSQSQATWKGVRLVQRLLPAGRRAPAGAPAPGARPAPVLPRVTLTLVLPRPRLFALTLPAPPSGMVLRVNRAPVMPPAVGKSVPVARVWKTGDQVSLLPLSPTAVPGPLARPAGRARTAAEGAHPAAARPAAGTVSP